MLRSPLSAFSGRVLGCLAALLAIAASPAVAQPVDPVEVSVAVSDESVAPGGWVVVAVTFDHEPGWHIHTSDPVIPESWGDFFVAIPTVVEVSGPAGTAVGAVQWPEEHTINVDLAGTGVPEPYAVYEGRAVAFVPVRVPESAAGGVELSVEIGYQACDDTTCIRPESLTRTVTVSAEAGGATEPTLAQAPFSGFDEAGLVADEPAPVPEPGEAADDPADAAAGEDGESVAYVRVGLVGLAGTALAAALGGFILNLTPCVLPVIPIKVMTLVKHGGESRGRTLVLGLWMAAGVIAFWVAIGLPMAFLNSALDPSRLIFGNWWVTLSLGLLIGLLGFGIMGLFSINLPQSVYAVNPRADSPHGSFLFGVMTAVLGLPCFGFVAGGLLATATTMTAVQIMTVFGGLGVGMAAPYLVLAAYPKLVERLPRTGPASELVKQVMGLLMFAAAAFFIAVGIYTLIAERPWMATNMKWWAAALFVAAAGFWLVFRTFQITGRAGPRVVFSAIALALVVASGWWAADSTGKSHEKYQILATAGGSDDYVQGAWNRYTPEKFDRAIADGKVVVVDFTAEWCLNCKAYRRTVLDRDPVASRLAREDVVTFEGDVTSSSDPADAFMTDLGITGIPQLAIFGPGIDVPLLSNAAPGSEVVRRIDRAAGETATALND